MKVSRYIILAAMALALSTVVCSAAPLEQIDVPALPDAKLATEINLPQGSILDSLTKEYGPWLGISDLKQISAFIYDINPAKDARDIMAFYDPTITAQDWKTMVRSVDSGQAVGIFYNEHRGMLIIQIDAPNKSERQATVIRIFARMDPSKISNAEGKLPDLFKKVIKGSVPEATASDVQAASKIPTDQPISVPPSQRLHIKSTRSDIKARVLDRATAEIRLASHVDDPGELIRIEERLILALTPKLPVSEIILPGTVPVLLEPTEGSLDVSCGPGASDRPIRLGIVATGAPVTVEGFPLISGTHTIKSIGGPVQIDFASVQGGVLNVEVTGKDLVVNLPKDASALISATATSGAIENLTGVQAQNPGPDHISLQLGTGKADMILRVVNGTIRIKYSNQ
jgi:hypothetical protein